MMNVKKRLASLALTCTLSLTANFSFADAATDKLSALLQGYQTFSTHFQQITLSDNGSDAEKVEGILHVAKPNLFRWETSLPYPQEIVSDGQYIWIHDPDLEQVTQKSAAQQQTSAPALILNGQIDELAKHYAIRLANDSSSEPLFDLVPIDDQSNFSRIRLAFSDQTISELMLEDSLGQRTSLVFFDQELNPKQDESLYFFRIPAGADVIVDLEG